jgi:hypothetical protein
MIATTNRPANTRATSNLEVAEIIRKSIPAFDATFSDTTEPTSAKVIAIFNEAKIIRHESWNSDLH